MASFLRKRSGSQCSFSNGDDAITVRRIDQIGVNLKPRSDTIQSTRSSCSSVDASDFAIHESCVIRNFPKHKSSHLRFLAWVAYTRKYTNEYITEDERRTCPLLWCREVFDDQEAMLQHVWNCPYLSKGLYWCFHCQKPERVGKFQCKRCQGAPSRTDRMASVAKKIFSKLGSKTHRAEHPTFAEPSESLKGLSKVFEEAEPSVPSYFQDPFQRDHGMNWGPPDAQELPNTSIIPEMAGDWTAASHELPDTYISEMVGTECPIELGGGLEVLWEDNFYAENLEEWDVPSLPVVKTRGSSPKLALDTSVAKNMSSSNWTDTPLSATIISPMSATGRFEATRSPVEISPTDSEASGNSFFTDSGYSSATTYSATFSTGSFQRFPSIDEKSGKKPERDFRGVSKDWIDDTPCSIPPPMVVPVSIPSPTQILEEPSKIIHSAGICAASSKPRLESPHWHDAASLVQSFAEALDSHIQHTRHALRELPSTPTTQELVSMSRTSVVSIGLEVLAGILDGRHPSATVQIFAFIHVACALAIAVDDDEAKIHTQKWFGDCLAWAKDLKGERQKKGYELVARAIWEPLESIAFNRPSIPSQGNKENYLLTTCKHFLDILESLDSSNPNPSATNQQFDCPLFSFEHKAKTRVIDALIQKPSIEAFIEDVVNVESRLLQGQITSPRELELELVCAGKLTSQSDTAYARFLGHVTTLCDELYKDDLAGRSRTRYHMRDISRIKLLIPEEGYGDDENNNERGQRPYLSDVHDEGDDLLLLDLDLEMNMEFDTQQDVTAFKRDADKVLQVTHNSHTNIHIQHHQYRHQAHPQSHQQLPLKQLQQPRQIPQHSTPPHITLHPPTPTPIPLTPSLSLTNPAPTPTPASPSSPYQCHCGYIPTGEEKWKASNLRRHKRIQHAADVKVYVCRWNGCKSSFTRSDNLRCHVREKGHFEGAERGGRGGGEVSRSGSREARRKRRKMEEEEEGGGEQMGLR